jgi:hypothetical protein
MVFDSCCGCVLLGLNGYHACFPINIAGTENVHKTLFS